MYQTLFLLGSLLYAVAATGQVDKAADLKSKSKTETVVELDIIELDRHSATKPPADSVQVIIEKNQIIEEYRQKGELIMVKVIPTDGVPYYVDPQARNKRTGAFSDLINSGVEPVQWVIKRF